MEKYFEKRNFKYINASYIIMDYAGEIYQEYVKSFEASGYFVKCLNLINTKESNYYSPFNYIHGDEDILNLADTIIKSTNNKTDKYSYSNKS